MEEDGTDGTQVIHATDVPHIIDEEDLITDGGRITNALGQIFC